MEFFNRVWQRPENLPTQAELSDPDAWIERV
ncbi:zinc-dependent metalloprotease [Trueperella pyogenes]